MRPPRKEELSIYQRWWEDVDVLRFTPGIGPFSDSQEEDWFKRVGEDPNAVQWVIEVDGKPIGLTGIGGINWRHGNGETDLVIGEKSLWRKGIASEAMALRTAFCFRELNLHKIRTRAFMENEASERALQKAGYRQSGVQREEMFRDGRWHDIWMAEVQREDWERDHLTPSPGRRPRSARSLAKRAARQVGIGQEHGGQDEMIAGARGYAALAPTHRCRREVPLLPGRPRRAGVAMLSNYPTSHSRLRG